MNCTSPRVIRNKSPSGLDDISYTVPCGKCLPCRIQRSREWAVRMMHEMDSNKGKSLFVTLTYNDEHMPFCGGLCKDQCQRFFKRLRKYFEPVKIKYYLGSEYGDKGRPHYHIILFGLSPEQLELTYHGKGKRGDDLYTSAVLEKIWNKGFNTVGMASYDSARYVADYLFDKYSGEMAREVYYSKGHDVPFSLISKGIGKDYLLRNKKYFLDNLGCKVRGKDVGLPRYYRKTCDDLAELFNQQVANLAKEKEVSQEEFGIYDQWKGYVDLRNAKIKEKNIIARHNLYERKGDL